MESPKPLKLIDTHAHLDELDDIDLALDKAKEAGIIAIIAVGSNCQSNQKIIEICQKYPTFTYPALGLHPWELGKLKSSQIDDNLKFIEENITDAVAIGEIGLDYDKRVIKVASKELQKDVFSRLLRLAKKHQRPAIVHSRYAWKDAFELASETGVEKVVFHWFTGFSSVLKDIINAAYFISATPAAEYHEEHRRAIKETPLDRLLLETDCPVVYGREIKYRSQPTDVLRSLKAAAELKRLSPAIIGNQTTKNAIELFAL